MTTTTQSTVTRQTSEPLTTAVTYTAFSFFDVVLLRLTDLFLWSSPQLTLLLAGFYCFGGKLGGRQDTWLASWAGVVFLTVCVAVPLTAFQRHRRDAPMTGRRRAHRRKHTFVNFSALREDDQYRLERIAQGMNALGTLVSQQIHISEDDDVSDAKDSDSSPRGVAATFLAFLRAHMIVLAVSCAMTSLLAVAPRRVSLSHLFDLCLAPLCLAWLCVVGLIMAVVEPLQEAAAYRARSRALPNRVSHDRTDAGGSGNGETATRAARLEAQEEQDCDGVLAVSPHCVEQALRLRRLEAHPHLRGGGGPPTRYALPALSEKEAAALQQLLNFGAPFSTVLLKPLRLWNARTAVMTGAQDAAEDSPRHSRRASVRTGSVGDLGQCSVGQDAWRVAWERDGLRCEVKQMPIVPGAAGGAGPEQSIVTAMRLLMNVQRANVGSLQAILLDDPDGLLDAKKESFAYYWDPLLVERKVLKQLSYDVSVVRTVNRSAVHGVAPTEMTQIASSAVLLDYEQQTALKLYRPFGHHRKGKKLVSSATRGLRAFVSCAVPCPAALREPSSSQQKSQQQKPATQSIDLTSLTIGMEEADGSLSIGMLFSLNSAAEAMAYPTNWIDVLQRDATHRMERLASLVRTVGPQENEVAVYKNERGFQPLLLRQAFSERIKPDGAAAESVAATVAAAESADWLETPTKVSRTSQRDKTDPASSPSSASSERLAEISLRFVSDLIAQPVWKPVKVRDGAQIFSASTRTHMASSTTGEDVTARARGELLSAARAVKVRLFLPRATLPIVDDVLRRAELAPVYDPFVEQRVTLTALQAAELLSMAVPDLVEDDYGSGSARKAANAAADGSQGAAVRASPSHTTSLAEVTAKMAEARSRGQLIQWVRHRPPALGGLGALCLSPRDYVQRVTAGEYFTAADLFSTSHGSHGIDAAVQGKLPRVYRQLPPSTRMFLRCGEDASDVLPPLEGVYRGHVRLAGVLCWETTAGAAATAMQSEMNTAVSTANSTADVAVGGLEDVDANEKGVMLVRCVVAEPGGWTPSWLWNRSLEEELDNADQLRKLVADAVADRSVV